MPKAYKEVKERFDRGQPIDRTLFETAFANITNLYPPLYDYFMQGMSYEQIESDMKNRAEVLSQRYVQLCDDLQLPENLSGDYDVILKCRNLDSLQLFLNKMVNTDKSLDEIVSECLKELEEKRLSEIQREQEERERARMEAEYGYDDYDEAPSSNGGGMVKDILKIGLGVASGNKISGVSPRRDGKRDLYGTSVCQRTKSSSRKSMKMFSCIGCPAEDRCTKRTR